jgi:enterochelin esterase family protein
MTRAGRRAVFCVFQRTTPGVFLLVAALALPSAVSAQEAPAPAPGGRAGAAAQAGGRGGGPVVSPQIGADRRVTFRLRAPGAKEVLVALAGKRLPMQKDEQGLWTATTDALAPDIYTYSFVLDGATITDPSNREFQTSAGSAQNMFAVPGPGAWLPAPGVPRGAVARHVFHSTVANDEREFFVYTPPGYEARRAQAYPVFYLLHGLGDDAGRWLNAGGANNILDNLIAGHKAVPMVMVTTLGYGTADGPSGARGPRAQENLTGYTKILLDEVMPAVERSYNVSRDRSQRAIAGLSMGGIEALLTGLNHLDKFAWIGSFSGALVMFGNAAAPAAAPALPAAGAGPAAAAPAGRAGRAGRGAATIQTMDAALFPKMFPTLDAKANAQIRMLWIVCGTADGLIGVNRQFKEWLRSKNVRFTEQEVPDMAHVWPLWRQNVADMVPQLFQPKK